MADENISHRFQLTKRDSFVRGQKNGSPAERVTVGDIPGRRRDCLRDRVSCNINRPQFCNKHQVECLPSCLINFKLSSMSKLATFVAAMGSDANK